MKNLEEALHLRKQIHALQTRLSNLFGSDDEAPTKAKATTGGKTGKRRSGKRVVSAATRAKMAASQQARRAKAQTSNVATAATPSKRKKKRNLSPEGRAKIVAALKARHAAARVAKK